ncbi:uncharacterized protein N0V89_008500 [Didymosphaeria variabile]|uniref:Uncharacterized protein n=1 Tax=Didymosphaeria variabile TaxID=1932322 RepID=A0A9W9C8K8_9PLEO|nr:uncharacterized protein N0V89_008500 [Didymosphaeria variabile]KAJ4349881.1 hypothetical protein N0V89_008500 [Didymosphaeria variabile]
MNTKRRRDDDSDSDDDRYLKKSRPWNVQPSLPWAEKRPHNTNGFSGYVSKASPPHIVPGLEAVTPAESEHSEANSPASLPEDPQIILSPHGDIDYSMQMDEDEPDAVASQPPDSPFITNFRPAKLNFDLFNRDQVKHAPDISHRIPTPIYPSFQNAGVINGLGYPNSGLAGGMATSNGYLGIPSAPASESNVGIPHRRQRSQDRTIRMPSPISEDEDIPDTPTAQTQSQLSRLSVTTNYSSDRMDMEMPPPSATPTRGRKRSGALTGMGRFSMGYRDDCEKCRLRVPGHYSHFL